jgi:hypothetical protein
MTTAEFLYTFELVQDKYNTPYFPHQQVLRFLNLAVRDVFKEYLGNSAPGLGEPFLQGPSPIGLGNKRDELREAVLSSLERPRIPVESNSMGKIALVAVEAACQEADVKVELVKRVLVGEVEAEWVPYLSARTQTNLFCTPDATRKYYELSNGAIYLFPRIKSQAEISIIKKPRLMALEVNTDLSELVHEEVLALALRYAGIALSEQEIKSIK